MALEDLRTITELDEVQRAFKTLLNHEKELEEVRPLYFEAVKKAFSIVEPKYTKFIYKGCHLSELDIKAGQVISDIEDLDYASPEDREMFNKTYKSLLTESLHNNETVSEHCPYWYRHFQYRKALHSFLSSLKSITGVDHTKLSSSNESLYINFVKSIFDSTPC